MRGSLLVTKVESNFVGGINYLRSKDFYRLQSYFLSFVNMRTHSDISHILRWILVLLLQKSEYLMRIFQLNQRYEYLLN